MRLTSFCFANFTPKVDKLISLTGRHPYFFISNTSNWTYTNWSHQLSLKLILFPAFATFFPSKLFKSLIFCFLSVVQSLPHALTCQLCLLVKILFKFPHGTLSRHLQLPRAESDLSLSLCSSFMVLELLLLLPQLYNLPYGISNQPHRNKNLWIGIFLHKNPHWLSLACFDTITLDFPSFLHNMT